jgi:hypothetical protein
VVVDLSASQQSQDASPMEVADGSPPARGPISPNGSAAAMDDASTEEDAAADDDDASTEEDDAPTAIGSPDALGVAASRASEAAGLEQLRGVLGDALADNELSLLLRAADGDVGQAANSYFASLDLDAASGDRSGGAGGVEGARPGESEVASTTAAAPDFPAGWATAACLLAELTPELNPVRWRDACTQGCSVCEQEAAAQQRPKRIRFDAREEGAYSLGRATLHLHGAEHRRVSSHQLQLHVPADGGAVTVTVTHAKKASGLRRAGELEVRPLVAGEPTVVRRGDILFLIQHSKGEWRFPHRIDGMNVR